MKRLVALLILSSLPALAIAAPSKSLLWKGSLSGRSTDDSLASSKTVSLGASIKGFYKPSSLYWIDLEAKLNLETGSSSSLFTEEFRPRSGIDLRNAAISVQPLDSLVLSGGALEQSYFKSPLLVDGGTFPALRETLSLSNDSLIAELSAQQAIPTGSRLSQKSTVGKEATPSLLSESATLGFKKNKSYFLSSRVTHFAFKNLTRGIAQDSRFYGNTINGVASASQFTFAYQGLELGVDGGVALADKLQLNLGTSFVNNNKAPSNRNKGRFIYAETELETDSIKIAPRLEHYYNETDASPAYYSSAIYGHNNRKGLGTALRISFLKDSLDVTARWAKTKLIEPQTFQRNNFSYIEISLETPYAPF